MFNNLSTACSFNRATFLSAFVAVVFSIMAFAVSAEAATFTVNTTADTQDVALGNGLCADSGGACSLRAAISEANALAGADTITLPAGTYTTTLASANEDANAGGDFDFTTPITINGAGAATTIVQANASINTANERVVHILAGGTAVTIADVTIRNGVFRFAGAAPNPQAGGGIRVEGSTANLTLNNSTVTGNLSENRGGGIGVNKGTVNINGCTFNNNQSGSAVAGSSASGGAISIDSEDNVAVAGQTAVINNTIINANRAESSVSNTFGGGIAVRAIGANVSITGSTITANISNGIGAGSGFAGGISNQQATMTITNSSVSFNTSSRFQAGIRNLSLTAAASTLNITNSTIGNNTSSAADALGGGIANLSSGSFAATANIDRSTISDNNLTGTTSGGGGLYNNSTSTGAAAMTVTNSTVSGNKAQLAAGIYSDGAAATCVIDFSTIASNTAVGEGGGVYQESTVGGSTTIKNSIFANNSATQNVDVSELVTSTDYNHIENPPAGFSPATHDVTGSDPSLGPLANNGGPTQTHLPAPSTVVLDTIPGGTNGCGTTITNDQRGTFRPGLKSSACEKGSVELQFGGTPTGTNTSTPTHTPTPTATNTATPSATPTGAGTPSISGNVTYGNAVGLPNPRFVSNVQLTGSGSPNIFATTDAGGNYLLTGFGAGSYTVTPSKTDGQNGITSFDAARIAQHAAGVTVLTGNQFLVADISGNGQLSSFDAAQLARYVIGQPPFGLTGTWIFVPADRSYGSVTGNLVGQDFIALLMGDVSGNWSNSAGTMQRRR